MNYIEIARNLALEGHKNQTRRDGKPYFTHVEAVANEIEKNWNYYNSYNVDDLVYHKDEIIAAGFNHDLGEDQGFTTQMFLDAGLTYFTAQIIEIVTKLPNENYFDFIERIAYSHKNYDLKIAHGAKIVKLADLEHNLSDNLKEGSQKDKYRFAKHYLQLLLEIHNDVNFKTF